MPAQTIALVNQKGGVGKTTSTLGLADTYAHHGLKVLVVDADPQGNATSGLGIYDPEYTLNDVLAGDATTGEVTTGVLADAATPAGQGWTGVDVIAASPALAAREQDQVVGREYRLRTAMDGALDRWDIVLIDCPPSLGQLTINALTAADAVLVITEARAGSIDGVSKIISTLRTVRKHFNNELQLAGIVVNRYRPDRRDAADHLTQLKADYGDLVIATHIPDREVINTAASAAAPLSAYSRSGPTLEALEAIATHLTNHKDA